jgi:hypothetical protein
MKNKIYISIILYILITIIYYNLRDFIQTKYGETGNKIFVLFLLILISYIYWNMIYPNFGF